MWVINDFLHKAAVTPRSILLHNESQPGRRIWEVASHAVYYHVGAEKMYWRKFKMGRKHISSQCRKGADTIPLTLVAFLVVYLPHLVSVSAPEPTPFIYKTKHECHLLLAIQTTICVPCSSIQLWQKNTTLPAALRNTEIWYASSKKPSSMNVQNSLTVGGDCLMELLKLL